MSTTQIAFRAIRRGGRMRIVPIRFNKTALAVDGGIAGIIASSTKGDKKKKRKNAGIYLAASSALGIASASLLKRSGVTFAQQGAKAARIAKRTMNFKLMNAARAQGTIAGQLLFSSATVKNTALLTGAVSAGLLLSSIKKRKKK